MTLADDGLSVESGPARSGSSGDATNSFLYGRFFYRVRKARLQRAINDAIYMQPIASAEEKNKSS